MAIVQLLYTPLERVRQLAYFGVILGLAAILGPIVGGMLIDLNPFDLGWRVIFLINFPIGLIAIGLGWYALPAAETKAALRIDPLGALIFCGAFGALLFGLIEGGERAWRPDLLFLMAGAVMLLAVGWFRANRRLAAERPTIIRPDLFRIGTFRWATSASLGLASGSIGFLLVFAIALQSGLGLSPLDTALVHIPFGAGVMMGVGFLVPRLLPRIGKKLPMAGGSLMLAGTVTTMAMIRNGNAGDGLLLAVLTLAGVGMGCLSGPLGPIVVAEVPRQLAGTASATFRTSQQIGGALGIALVGGAYFGLAGGANQALDGLFPASLVVAALLLLAVASVSLLPSRLFGHAD